MARFREQNGGGEKSGTPFIGDSDYGEPTARPPDRPMTADPNDPTTLTSNRPTAPNHPTHLKTLDQKISRHQARPGERRRATRGEDPYLAGYRFLECPWRHGTDDAALHAAGLLDAVRDKANRRYDPYPESMHLPAPRPHAGRHAHQ